MKIALWSITVIAIGSMSFPIWSACLYSSQKAAIIADGEVTKLSIQGMTCAECVMSIEKSVKKIPGVQDVSVSLEDSKASIVTVPGKVSHEDIVNAVKLAGPFEAQVLEKGGTE